MDIKLAELIDIPEMNILIEKAKRHWGYSDELMTIWLPDLLISSEDYTNRLFWKMSVNEEMLGVFSVSIIDDNYCELEDFWLHPLAIGKGLGGEMFQFVIRYLKKIKSKVLIINADPNAEGFYLRMGAERIKLVESKPKGRMLPLMELLL